MLQQQISELDFDTYFDVSSNTTQQQHLIFDPNAQQQSVHPTQQLGTSSRYPQQQYFMPQQQQQHQQPTFEMLDWCFKQQQQQQQQHQLQLQSLAISSSDTPASTPEITTNNQADYFYSVQQPNSACTAPSDIPSQFNLSQHRSSIVIKEEQINYEFSDESNPVLYNVPSETTTTTATPVNNNGLPTPMSDVIFPGTPQSRNSIPSESNSPSPVSSSSNNNVPQSSEVSPPLVNAFAAIDQWGKNIDKTVPDCTKEEYHETRHWRKHMRSDSLCSNTSNMVAAAVAAVAARSTPRTPVETGRQLKKVAHNAIERRYRNNINDRIRDLKNVVPALYKAKIREKKSSKSISGYEDEDSSDDECHMGEELRTGEIVDGVEVAKKLNKATILHKATEYIHHLKHKNELARRENQVLQQILAQMPGGAKVLTRFQMQKNDFEQAEQQRLLNERKELMERERAERQRMLRERAAQRAALAELLPKTERRPYRRRVKKDPMDKDNSVVSSSISATSTAASSPTGSPAPEEVKTNDSSDLTSPN